MTCSFFMRTVQMLLRKSPVFCDHLQAHPELVNQLLGHLGTPSIKVTRAHALIMLSRLTYHVGLWCRTCL
jgi:hypothetical protein